MNAEHAAHRQEMDQPRAVVAAEQPAERRQLHRLVHHQPGQQRDGAEDERARIGQLLQRIVLADRRRFRAEQKVVPRHRPHAWQIARHEQAPCGNVRTRPGTRDTTRRPPAKIHMNVKCHCSAPPSQPPSAIAFGTSSIRFCCGIFAPKLGNAVKICSPLMASTVIVTALAQCENRTAHGCANTGRLAAPCDRFRVRHTSCILRHPSSCCAPAARRVTSSVIRYFACL